MVYCCQSGRKINPEIFAVWCSILQEVPGSVLWLSLKPAAERNRQRLCKRPRRNDCS